MAARSSGICSACVTLGTEPCRRVQGVLTPAMRGCYRRRAMPTARMRRVNEAIREILGDAIATELKDPRIGFVTVTEVDTSPDLRAARVYVSVLGSPEERESSLAGLHSAHGFL